MEFEKGSQDDFLEGKEVVFLMKSDGRISYLFYMDYYNLTTRGDASKGKFKDARGDWHRSFFKLKVENL